MPREGATGGVERSGQRCGITRVGRAVRVGEQQSQAGDPGRVERGATPQQRRQAHEAVAVGRHRSHRAGDDRPPGTAPEVASRSIPAASWERRRIEVRRAARSVSACEQVGVPAGDEGSVERVGAEGGDQAGPRDGDPGAYRSEGLAVLRFDAFVTPPFRYSWCR